MTIPVFTSSFWQRSVRTTVEALQYTLYFISCFILTASTDITEICAKYSTRHFNTYTILCRYNEHHRYTNLVTGWDYHLLRRYGS